MANTKTIGDITEAMVLAAFVAAGIPVSVPFGENQRYDLIADVHGTLLRVQCKTGRVAQSEAVLIFNATSHDGHRARQSYRGQADLFAVYSPHTRQVYVLGVDEVGETNVWLRLIPAKNNQEIGVRYADEHTLAAWAARLVRGRDDQRVLRPGDTPGHPALPVPVPLPAVHAERERQLGLQQVGRAGQ